jgi:hypothetical protein
MLKLPQADSVSSVDIHSLQAGRAKETDHSYGDNLLRVNTLYLKSLDTSNLIQRLSSLPLVQHLDDLDQNWDVRLCSGDCPAGDQYRSGVKSRTTETLLTLQRADGTILTKLVYGTETFGDIATILERESRWQFVHKLSNSTTAMKVDLRIVPVEVKTHTACGDVPNAEAIIRDIPLGKSEAKLQLSPCDYVMLEVRYSRKSETAPEDAWISVLDLQNNGHIGPLWPNPRDKTQDNHLAADGAWHRIPYPFVFRIEEPLGRETFKLIATSDATDFGPVVDPGLKRGVRNSKEQNAMTSPLGQLLRAAAQGKRSTAAGKLPDDWASTSVEFEVGERR